MEPKNETLRYEQMLKCYTHLPKKMLALQHIDNVTEFVLHSLCTEGYLNLAKAAYFIDNPDFDCLKGIAGFDRKDKHHTDDVILANKEQFTSHISDCAFNQKVKNIEKSSPTKRADSHEEIVKEISKELNINNPLYRTWNIKHENYGLLIFEGPSKEEMNDEFLQGLSLLGFCPIS